MCVSKGRQRNSVAHDALTPQPAQTDCSPSRSMVLLAELRPHALGKCLNDVGYLSLCYEYMLLSLVDK